MFFRFPCHKIAVILDHHLACVAGSKMVDGREGGRVPIPNLPPISLPCLIHLDAYCTYHAGYPLILACNAEMPTSGDLNSGVSLFFTTPFPHPECQQPPHPAPPSPHGFGHYMMSYMTYMLSRIAFNIVMTK